MARAPARRPFARARAAEQLVAGGPEPRLEGALRRALAAGRLGPPALPAEPRRRRRAAAGAHRLPERRHREAALGVQVQRLPLRRAAAPRRLGLGRGPTWRRA